ncbi:hypothetical protein UK23_32345 [Lentzea aerocolonigenes]|uniref:GS catalytic domain-containing protein n=1 Tax=Lentzea aerocolonigenes TaxID=68170 RepID=A0A0F0GM73_LENAE|nr:hypothetical protein UK23_32345 [Lentzea aerocolonigenes]
MPPGVELIRFLWVDLNGLVRGKGVTRSAYAARMHSGIGMATMRQAAALCDRAAPVPEVDGMEEVRVMADHRTFGLLPHAPGSAAVLSDLLRQDGTPWGACPRTFLRGAVARAEALGFDVVAAFEPEFTLLREAPDGGTVPFDDSLTADNDGFDATNDLVVALIRALRAQGLEPEVYHPEFAAGQHELTIGRAPALRAADEHVWQRVLTRGLARARGLRATFAPVPKPGFRGNGNHLHVSLWHDGRNVFADPADGLGLSATARHFIGGVLAHLPGLLALTTPSVNSYRRFQRGMFAGAFACYGLDNREAAVRVPSRLRGDESGSVNVEFKPCDATANPYLALGAVVHAGLDGVERRLDPGGPMAEDPNTLSGDELTARGVARLPGSLEEALDELLRDELLTSVLGSPLLEIYEAVKRADVRDVKGLDDEQHHALYCTRY